MNFGFVSAPHDGYDMAVGHQVQNFQRRGNIFYWYPRLGRNIGARHLGLPPEK